jgi:hypothetical protein
MQVGGEISLDFSCQNASMSILYHGQDAIQNRQCIGEREQQLLSWFATVEESAWGYVNATAEPRPNSIYLVIGQVLTNEYAIAHNSAGSMQCSLSVAANVDVAGIINQNIRLGTSFQRVSVLAGFPLVMSASPDNTLHSIFMKVRQSGPMSRFRKKSLLQRLAQFHK